MKEENIIRILFLAFLISTIVIFYYYKIGTMNELFTRPFREMGCKPTGWAYEVLNFIYILPLAMLILLTLKFGFLAFLTLFDKKGVAVSSG